MPRDFKSDYFRAFDETRLEVKEGSLYKAQLHFNGFNTNHGLISVKKGDIVVYLGLELGSSDSLSDVADYRPKFLFKEQVIITSSTVIYGKSYLERMDVPSE